MFFTIKNSYKKAISLIIFTTTLLSLCHLYTSISFLPFNGHRPNPTLLHDIICPPYNSLSLQDATTLAKENPYSILHISRPEVSMGADLAPYSKISGRLSKENLQKFIQNNWLIRDKNPCFYLYEQTTANNNYRSIIGLIAVKHYKNNDIKRHENTIPEKELTLTQFTYLQQANVDPVVLMYKTNKTIENLFKKYNSTTPTQAFTAQNGSLHKIWTLDNPALVNQIRQAFAQLSTLYIADGHHRSAAALRLQQDQGSGPDTLTNPYNYFLATLIPDNQISLTSYNRIIKGLNGHTKEEFLKKLSFYFYIKKVASKRFADPREPFTFGMLLDNFWYYLRLKKLPIKLNTPHTLDMTILNEAILKPILGITSLNDYTHVESISGGLDALKKLKHACKKKNWRLGFALHPVSINTFINIVEQGDLMPAKTTWFEPKMWQGLVIRKFN